MGRRKHGRVVEFPMTKEDQNVTEKLVERLEQVATRFTELRLVEEDLNDRATEELIKEEEPTRCGVIFDIIEESNGRLDKLRSLHGRAVELLERGRVWQRVGY